MNRRHDDDGSVLIMALAFLSLFGLAVAAVLGFAETGFRAATAVHQVAAKQYAADAAIDGTINAIRGNVAIGKEGATPGCFALPASAVNAVAVTVDCTGRTGSGAGSVSAGGGLVPVNAVLAVNQLPASSPNEGVVLSATAAPVVLGNVVVNESRITPAGSTLTVQGSLTCKAVSGTGAVTATTTSCPAAVAPAVADPGYAADITSIPNPGTVPACGAGATVTFAPGAYRSAAALNALTNGGCLNKRFHFTPGTYYFEFTDTVPPGTHQWQINDTTAEVVGGTLTATAFPSRCDTALAGVQFVFGADSRLLVAAGSLELCPPLSAGQRIAVYGAKATADIVVPLTTLTPTNATSTAIGTEPNVYTPPLAGRIIGDGVEAKFTASTNKGIGALSLGGFSTSAIPANAEITSATVRVASRYENAPFSASPKELTLTPADGSAAVPYAATPCAFASCAMGTVSAPPIDVFAQINTPARANGIAMEYRVQDKQGIPYYVSYVDGVALDIGYRIPGLKAASGCAAVTPYSPSTGTTCAVLRGAGASAKMAIKGTVYAPLAAVDLSMTGQTNAVTQRGVVARTLYLGMTRAAAYTGALLALGAGTADRTVLLTALIGGAPVLRADVRFADGNGVTPGATVTVNSWSVLQ